MAESTNKSGFKKILKIVLLVLLCTILAFCIYIFIGMRGNVANIKRIDPEGSLYYADYVTDYYDNPVSLLAIKVIKAFGCSAFITYNEDDDVITCRNYDLAHKDSNGELFGLNVVVRLKPEGKYESIGTADVAWLSMVGIPYKEGALDEGEASTMPLTFLPYLCMDGLNEKGLSASVLAVNVKNGEQAANQNDPGKKSLTITELLRYIVDNCATVDEAVAMAKSYNISRILNYDYHMFITDAVGKSVVLEWRNNILTETYTNAVTNFYVGYDDAADVVNRRGELKEKFIMPAEKTFEYHYGHGHGYNRFNILADGLENHVVSKSPYKTQMSESDAVNILKDSSLGYKEEFSTSFTQYSLLYNNTDRTMDIWTRRNFDTKYSFIIENK